MGRPVFVTESRSVRRPVGLPTAEKASLWPTVDAILADFRADNALISDQIVLEALNGVLSHAIFDGRYHDVYVALGKLLGVDEQNWKLTPPAVECSQSGKERTAQEVGNASTVRVSDAEARRMLGRTKTPV